MLINVTHEGGVQAADEVQFETPFGYMFPQLLRHDSTALPVGSDTVARLRALGSAMADPGTPENPATQFDSKIPAAYTYLGQFIDHDITARTDRETRVSQIVPQDGSPLEPLDPQHVVSSLTNGRRPQLDLDSLYGDGPGLIEGVRTEAASLYDDDLALRVVGRRGFVDVPRDDGKARIADMRNDENVIVSQLHAAFLRLHNRVLRVLPRGSDAARYARARQLVRWAYQYVVLNDYLPRVCDPDVVEDVMLNGPRHFPPVSGGAAMFMPLEFSVAGFRFGHSMIRPFYELNDRSDPVPIMQLLEASAQHNQESGQLRPDRVVDWDLFVGRGRRVQRARRIDPKIAQGLFALPTKPGDDPVLAHLARRNLLRAYLLRIPTGQACAAACGIVPLRMEDLTAGESPDVADALRGPMQDRTPLWYYLLKEAAVQKRGESLGAVGSRIVAETLVGLVKADPNSYLYNAHDPAVQLEGRFVGIDLNPKRLGGLIRDLPDLLEFARVA